MAPVRLRVLLGDAAQQQDHLREGQLRHAARVRERRVEHRHGPFPGHGQLHLVGADAEAAHGEQPRRGAEHVRRELRAGADAQDVHVLERIGERRAGQGVRELFDLTVSRVAEDLLGPGMDALEEQDPDAVAGEGRAGGHLRTPVLAGRCGRRAMVPCAPFPAAAAALTRAGASVMENAAGSAGLQALIDALGADAVRTEPDALETWGRDWTRTHEPAPLAVVFPRSTGDVRTIVVLANRHGLALVPSGGRTGLSGGAVAAHGEVVVSLDRMRAVQGVDPVSRLLRCEAGAVTAEVQAAARDAGLYYPVDFASAGSSQIGGNVATNAGGIKVIRYGMTREWVRGLTVVTGRGDVLHLNRGLTKNNTGYDLRHLFVGSEGTLGIVTEVMLALTSPPPELAVLFLGVRDFAAVQGTLKRFAGAVTLQAFEFLSDNALDKVVEHQGLAPPLGSRAPYYVLLEFERATDVAEAAALEAFEAGVEAGEITDGVLAQSVAQARALWRLREDISETISRWTPYKNDLSVTPDRLGPFLTGVEDLVAARYPDFEVCWYGHIGDGNLHLNILKPEGLDRAAFFERCHAVSEDVMALIERLEGSVSAEHGVGLLKRDFLHHSRAPAEIALMRAIKRELDPNGILNPGKLFPPEA
jgi:FAD/FMN-containing dehydrogenase